MEKFQSKSPLSKLMMLDELISFAFEIGNLAQSISTFKRLIKSLKGLDIHLDEDLLIALMLRQLPDDFKALKTNLRHRETLDFDTAIEAIEAEGRVIASDKPTVLPGHALATTSRVICAHCKVPGHMKDKCWTLHPELKPSCDNCGMDGHWAKNCRRKARDQQCHFASFDSEPYDI